VGNLAPDRPGSTYWPGRRPVGHVVASDAHRWRSQAGSPHGQAAARSAPWRTWCWLLREAESGRGSTQGGGWADQGHSEKANQRGNNDVVLNASCRISPSSVDCIMSRSFGPYHTLEELIGRKVVVADLLEKLSKIARSDVLRCLAGFSALLERHENGAYQQQIKLLHEITSAELATQVEEALKMQTDPFGALFHRRQLWFVLQMAVLSCTNDSTQAHDSTALKEVGECCLMANDLLKAVECVQRVDPQDTKNLDYLIATLISYTELSFGSEVVARSQLFWLEMPEEELLKRLAKRLGMGKTLDEAFAEKYGIPLKELLLFATVLYYKFMESTIRDVPSSLMYDSTKAFHDVFDSGYREKALRLISAAPDELAARLLGSPRQSWATDSTALIKTPLLRLGETQYVCPDLHMFRAFLVQGVFELLMDAVDPGKLKQYLGGLFERYVQRLMRSFAPASQVLVNTFFSPVEFAFDGDEAADGMLLWTDFAVLLECKTSMLTTRQRYAMSLPETTKAIDDQFASFQAPGEKKTGERNKRKGIGQLAYNMARILKGDQVKQHGKPIDLFGVKKFYPAVVVYDEGVANHGVRLYLQLKMVEWFDANGIDHSRVGHVLLFTIRDIEFYELLAHRIGAEKLMRDYIAFVEVEPRNLHSMFHEYALNHFPVAKESTGLTHETTERVLKAMQSEIDQRKANLSRETSSE